MIIRKLAAVFARYVAAHLHVSAKPLPLQGEDDQISGMIDRVYVQGQRLHLEGWAKCERIILAHAGLQLDVFPNLPRRDVVAAHPELLGKTPGFAVDIAFSNGPATLTMINSATRVVYALPRPAAAAIRRARARLLWPFLRDLASATPSLLHWLFTKDPRDVTRLKQHFRLNWPAPTRAMQPLMFLADSLAEMTESVRRTELARLQPKALACRAITIIVPVYNALDLLPEVLGRVIRHTDMPWRLILIEDASPDAGLRPYLRQWVQAQNAAGPARVTLIENAVNQGFIKSVNIGLKLALGYGDHVVLLNTDAFVPQGWASRLMRPFQAHDRVATVTPMSNDAEIFSAPVLCQRHVLSPGDADVIDATAARIHPDAALADAPTGVGFCMAMSIDYLRKIPALDTAFGRGYGEEVDWCQKARAIGGRHLGLANLFVEHRGGTSFGHSEKQRLLAQNGEIITRRYPSYDADVQGFIANDPLFSSRLALAIAWTAAKAKTAVPLYIAHSLGGGAEDYLLQRIEQHLPDPVLVLRVGGPVRWQLELHSTTGKTCGSTASLALIRRLLEPIAALHVLYSCGVGDSDPAELPLALLTLRRRAQDRFAMLLHDYFPISPSYTLLNAAGQFCGVPDIGNQDPAHQSRSATGGQVSLAQWQKNWGQLITASETITAFSHSSQQIFSAAYPDARQKLQLSPHQPLVNLPAVPRLATTQTRVIGVLGNIGLHKGAAVLQAMSHRLNRDACARLVLLGRLDPMFSLASPAVVHGGYQRGDIPALAAHYGITDWLIPSIWPETFSYTTHEAIATGLPVWGFDLGAQGDAIRHCPQGQLLGLADGVADLEPLFASLTWPAKHAERAAA